MSAAPDRTLTAAQIAADLGLSPLTVQYRAKQLGAPGPPLGTLTMQRGRAVWVYSEAERAAIAGYVPRPRPPITACPQGHPYDPANTYVSPKGRRACRACHHARSLAHERATAARKRAAKIARSGFLNSSQTS